MKKSKITIPLGLLLIMAFYVFGAIVLLIFLLIGPAQVSSTIAEVHGLPVSTGTWILLLIAILGLPIAFGLLTLSQWGYILAMMYFAYFGIINGSLLRTHNDPIYLGNFIWSILVIIYLILIGTACLGPWQLKVMELSGQPENALIANQTYDTIRILVTAVGLVQVIMLICIVTLSALKPWGKRQARQKKINVIEHGPEVAA